MSSTGHCLPTSHAVPGMSQHGVGSAGASLSTFLSKACDVLAGTTTFSFASSSRSSSSSSNARFRFPLSIDLRLRMAMTTAAMATAEES